MALALYRKYRSRSLDDVVGQDHVTSLLRNAIKQDKIAHAYLFTGPRGVGKTSIARIVAHEINGLPYEDETTHLDIVEIDAASNNGVDDIRDLRDRVQIAPVSAKKKVYIIDEVHMLSKQAFNALLKTLEEPPEHVVFILATTDIDKVPSTILSRTQRHTFRRAVQPDIVTNLKHIAESENISADDDALALIARHSQGSFRDSVSLFDQLSSGVSDGSALTAETVRSSLGLAGDDMIETLIKNTVDGDLQGIREALSRLEQSGVPARTTATGIIYSLESRIDQDSKFVRLIDSLLELGRSSHPDLKLLTTLSLFAPITTTYTPANPKTLRTSEEPTRVEAAPVAPKTAATSAKPEASKKKLEKEVTAPASNETKQVIVPSEPFDWQKLIEYVRTHHVALHSVLSKCQPHLQDKTLTLYTKSNFYKKKLDDSRYRLMLNGALDAIGMSGLDIDTVPTGIPLKDSDAAKVAAIMGGGEEVNPDE